MGRTANRSSIYKDTSGEIRSKAGLYLRLSMDSDYTGSDSIESQRLLGEEYEKDHPNLKIVREYVDDGFSGAVFYRPAFDRMMMDLKAGGINCVIVKDLSRFGRSYLDAGNYIEKVFPFMQVRFISITDRYDSADPKSERQLLMISLKNLINDLYVKDLSKKIGSVYKMKQEEGIFYRSATVPYGYKMNESGDGYVEDVPAAEIVKRIFKEYQQGHSMHEISRSLERDHIATPKQYCSTGRIWGEQNNEMNHWQLSTVKRILRNRVYVGDIVRHKSEQSLYTGVKYHKATNEEQQIIRNCHSGIIDYEIFEAVQHKLDQTQELYKGYRKMGAEKEVDFIFSQNVFSGFLFCGICKSPMQIRHTCQKQGDKEVKCRIYKCKANILNHTHCSPHFISERDLAGVLFDIVTKQMQLIKDIKKVAEQDIRYSFNKQLKQNQLIQEQTNHNIVMLKQEYMLQYEAYVAGLVQRSAFEEIRKYYVKKQSEYEKQLKENQRQRLQIEKAQDSLRKLVRAWLIFEKDTQLTEQMLLTCFKHIEIYPDNRISVTLNYQDCFESICQGIEKAVAR